VTASPSAQAPVVVAAAVVVAAEAAVPL